MDRVDNDVLTLRALDVMEAQGGSFASALAKAWRKADMDNARRLAQAFPGLLEEYEHRAQAIIDRENSAHAARRVVPG